MRRKTLLAYGPPGTGKTGFLTHKANAAIERGVPPEQICYTTFTRRAAQEAIERIVERYGVDPERLTNFGTLHSLAFRHLGLSPDQVMGPKHYTDLGERLGGYRFASEYDSQTERVYPEGEIGDICMYIYHYARSKLMDPRDAWQWYLNSSVRLGSPVTQNLPYHVVDYLIRGLTQYKKVHGLYDFSDFLDECQVTLNLQLMIIDEGQDLTPQQWRFARRLGANAPDVTVAGDDDQTIFDWAGGDVSYLLGLAGERMVLPISHRLPRAVYEYIMNISGRIKQRQPKDYQPRKSEGLVKMILDPRQADIGSGEWMLLARTNWLCHRLVGYAREAGVVYFHNGAWSHEDPTVLAIVAYERMRKGGTVARAVAQLAAKYADGVLMGGSADAVSWDQIVWPFDDRPDWMSGLHRIGIDQREYVRRCLKNGESLTKPGRIKISTIHQSKGGEAENVLVLGDMTPKVEASFWDNMDAELRVWYVAMSRARERLFIVAPPRHSPLLKILTP